MAAHSTLSPPTRSGQSSRPSPDSERLRERTRVRPRSVNTCRGAGAVHPRGRARNKRSRVCGAGALHLPHGSAGSAHMAARTAVLTLAGARSGAAARAPGAPPFSTGRVAVRACRRRTGARLPGLGLLPATSSETSGDSPRPRWVVKRAAASTRRGRSPLGLSTPARTPTARPAAARGLNAPRSIEAFTTGHPLAERPQGAWAASRRARTLLRGLSGTRRAELECGRYSLPLWPTRRARGQRSPRLKLVACISGLRCLYSNGSGPGNGTLLLFACVPIGLRASASSAPRHQGGRPPHAHRKVRCCISSSPQLWRRTQCQRVTTGCWKWACLLGNGPRSKHSPLPKGKAAFAQLAR
jgi:hypothetical protein